MKSDDLRKKYDKEVATLKEDPMWHSCMQQFDLYVV